MTSRPFALLASLGLLVASALANAQSAPSPKPDLSRVPDTRGVPIIAPQTDPWPGMKKLLVVADVQTGFHHDSINHAMAVIEQMGREHKEWATVIRTDSQLITKAPIVGQGSRYKGRMVNARNLDHYDAVFFLGSGSGTDSLTEQQKADLLSFVRDDGKGFIAGHASTVANYEWPAFIDMIGGFMDYEFRPADMALINEDPSFPGAKAFPKKFKFNDQFPVMRKPFTSKDVHVILRLDAAKLTPEQLQHRPDGDLPVVWSKPYGKGRVYNVTIGHREEVWDDKRFREMVRQGILWAMGGGGPPAPQKPAGK